MNIQQTISLPTRYISTIDVLGPKDCFLDLIRADTTAKISVYNEEEISIYGSQEEVERVNKLFDKLIDIASTHEPITTTEVGVLINQSHDGDFFVPQDDSLILKYGKKEIRTRTKGQQEYLNSLRKNDITIAIGAPGTSKTFTAVCYGLSLLKNKEIDKIVICRPMVEAKGENSLGSLPGEIGAKLQLYLLPMMDVFERVLGKEKLDAYIETGRIQMLPVGYMRGLSLYKTYLICDEAENLNITLAQLLVTRIGEGSKIIVCGDPMQQDSREQSGLNYLANSLESLSGVGVIRMEDKDIVRHPMITKMLKAFKEYDQRR